ncbi:MAG: hypothetical protein HKN04_05845, partial [Rhodothermaceae bacterium]|nr:hypothetical protein [Rhodothermaceae bacterium]
MPRYLPLILILAVLLGGAFWLLQSGGAPLAEGEADEQREPGWLEPTDWFFQQRAFPHGTIRPEAVRLAQQQIAALRADAQRQGSGGLWTFGGPTNVGGRVSSLAVESFDVFYVGTGSGGVFRTTDGGASFTSIGDDVLNLSIGDVALAPQNPQILYVGTGEVNGGGGSLTYGGQGVFRSVDAGITWNALGLEETGTIGRVVVHPTDANTVWVAAEGKLFAADEHRGVYRTTNAGATWDKTLFINDSTGVVDLAVNPRSPDTLYAAAWERQRRPDERHYGGDGSGLWRSIDGGQTWAEQTDGLPFGPNIGRIGISVSASRPNVVYAVYTDATGFVSGVYQTENGGDTWSLVGAFSGPSYGWWFGQIRVDPTNDDVVYAPWLNLEKSADGGQSWNYASGSMHVDQHALWIDPTNPDQLIAGNDGGVYRSIDGASTWTKAPGGFPATQFYTVEIDASVPERLYGGTQDNGTNRTLTGSEDDWQHIYGGDGFVVLVEPTNNQYVYAESQYGGRGRSTNGGASFTSANAGISGPSNWNTPIVFDPQDPTILYTGTDRVYRSTNRAENWTAISPDLTDGFGTGNLVFGTITTIDVAPSDPDALYAGTDDGRVWKTENGGTTWAEISAGLPQRWVTRVTVHPTQPHTAYVTLSGYRWAEDLARVYRTDNGGTTWTPRIGGLPEVPVNDLLFDPLDPDWLYLATDAGVFVSSNAGVSWSLLGVNLPGAPVLDLDLHDPTRTLVAATYGRGMYRYDLTQLPVATEPEAVPAAFQLNGAPNPFREALTLRYTVTQPGPVALTVYDVRGRRVALIEERERVAGSHTVR